MTATKLPGKTKTKAKKSNKKKLTLSLNAEVIDKGKIFAKDQGTSLSKLFERFLIEQTLEVEQPFIVIEPDPDILALMGKPAVPPKPRTNREYYDEYAMSRYNRYLKNSSPE